MRFWEKGVSLIEVLIVIVAVGFLVFLVASIPNAISLTTKSRNLSLAREIALKQVEDKRAVKYGNLVNGVTAVSDVRLALLPSGSGTVTVEDCDVAVCTNNEPIKSIKVNIIWTQQGDNETIEVTTLVGEGGLN